MGFTELTDFERQHMNNEPTDHLLDECLDRGEGLGILDFDSDEPLACPMRDQSGDTTCESCQ